MNTEKKYRTLIADDEVLSREYLKGLLSHHACFSITHECTNGADAAETIIRERPDFVFLDIQMPDLDGFGVIQKVKQTGIMPRFIFITAYDQYAVKAFEVNAIDYLLKPFDKNRFDDAVSKLLHAAQAGNGHDVNAMIENMLRTYLELKQQAFSDRLLVKSNKKIYLLEKGDIYWLEACGDYVKIHLSNHYHLVNDSLANYEEKLGLTQFVRVHRSNIVNLHYVKELRPHYNGEYVLILKNGQEVKLSRTYKDKFKTLFDLIE
jgi:two-component system LytT family response regulator